MSDASSSSTEPRFAVWIRRTGGPDGPFAIRFQMAGGKGILRLSRPGVLVDPPARATGEESRLNASQLRSARLLHVWGKGAFRQGYVMTRLDDEALARLPAEAWAELGTSRDGGQAFIVVPATIRIDPGGGRGEFSGFNRSAIPLSSRQEQQRDGAPENTPRDPRPPPFLRNRSEPARVQVPQTVETRGDISDHAPTVRVRRDQLPPWPPTEDPTDEASLEEEEYSSDDLPDTVEEESEELALEEQGREGFRDAPGEAGMDAFGGDEASAFSVGVEEGSRGGRAPSLYSKTGRIEDAVVQVKALLVAPEERRRPPEAQRRPPSEERREIPEERWSVPEQQRGVPPAGAPEERRSPSEDRWTPPEERPGETEEVRTLKAQLAMEQALVRSLQERIDVLEALLGKRELGERQVGERQVGEQRGRTAERG